MYSCVYHWHIHCALCTGDSSSQETAVGSVCTEQLPTHLKPVVCIQAAGACRSPTTDHVPQHSRSHPSQHHSTETAMLKICNDALMVANKGMVTLVMLLDYSAAFDTVDHSIMLQILGKRCGLSESVLQWHKTCLQSRTYAVVAGGMSSDTVQLECSLPQGSSLGPLKFIIYAAELHECIARHGIMVQSFADDTQLRIQTKVQHVTQAKQNMVAAIADISLWTSSRPQERITKNLRGYWCRETERKSTDYQ